jgi:hypothetical protein
VQRYIKSPTGENAYLKTYLMIIDLLEWNSALLHTAMITEMKLFQVCNKGCLCQQQRQMTWSSLTLIILSAGKLHSTKAVVARTVDYRYCCSGVRLYFCGTEPLMGLLLIPQMMCEWIWSSSEMILMGETEGLREKPALGPLCPPDVWPRCEPIPPQWVSV